ncbi:DUF4175 family protein [Mucilaginibacter myungsuensis]|uniref:DUF4175 family protein n=1 Tax=Mucilaginibacter myungsuensis TaxID=649104 RepID=A0A929L0H6_9SPHI|nr:DUF4175 family protein [Mucilaginibacter myungsuensis]MBE9661036.1 hypothetical protein [Mucilaginibacter myungsuensis]MDN3597180.1 hypothetical protein [Mucilaginibacter myungsuensis]
MNGQNNYELLIDKINVFIRKYYFNNLLRGLIFLGAGLFSAYVVITLSEYFFNFGTLPRTILFYSFILLNLGLLFWLVVPSLLAWLKVGKTLTHDEAAQIIGTHFSDVKDKLLNTLQLKKLSEQDDRNRSLIEASIGQKIEGLRPVSFPSAINLKENNKYLKWVLAPVGVIVFIALASPSILTESTKRLINHDKYYTPAAPFQFDVLNDKLSVVQGEDLKLDLKMTGSKIPADVYVETNGNTFKLDKENLAKFHYLFSNLQQNTAFRLSANGFYSQPYEIKVNLKPSLLNFDVELHYPSYLHKKDEKLINAGDLTLPAGTTVKWQLHTQNADKVVFGLDGKSTDIAEGNDGLFEHTERISRNAMFSLKPESKMVTRGDSASYRINVIADELPAITAVERADSISTKAMYFNGRIQDDHGFTSLTFHYKVGAPGSNREEKTITRSVKADLGQTQSDFFYYWDMKDIAVKPGDELTYYFEVADNDAVSGPKKARTPERAMKVPTEKELQEQLNAGTEAVKQKMSSAIKIAGQLERESQKLNQMLLNKNTLSFDEKKQVEDLMQKKKELNDLIKDIQAENRRNQMNRQENSGQSQELTDKQKQMDELLKNVLDPKTQEMLEKLQQLLEAERKEPTRDAVNKMQSENRNLKKELSRAQELMKKLEFDQKMDKTIKDLNKLAEKQEALAQKTDALDKKEQGKQNQDPKNQDKPNLGDKDKFNTDKKDQDKANADKATQDKANADKKDQQDKQNGDKQNGDKKDQDKANADKAAQDKAKADKAAQDKANADKQQQDKANADKQNADKQAGDKKDSQKTDAEKQAEKEQLQKEQDKLKEEFKEVEKQMDDLKKQNEQLEDKQEFDNSPQEKQSVEEDMDESKEQLKKDNKKQASKSQKQAAQKMKKMAQKMQEQKDKEEEEQAGIDLAQLRELLKSLVNSSFEQERVMQTLRSTSANDPQYVTLAQKQKDIKDNLKTAQDSLYSISKRVPQISSTVNKEIAGINEHIDKAIELLGDRRTAEANRDQQYAMTSLNNLALMLSEARDNMNDAQQSKKSGKSKKQSKKQQQSMQQLSKQQQQLNQNMQKMREQMQQQQQQGGKENQGQSQRQSMAEQFARMARQQQEIRQQLEQINQQDNKDGNNNMGDLQKIAKQMEQTENDLVNRKVTEESIRRQQQIQVKLLEAEKAEQQREEDNKRDSHAGKDIPPGYIKALQDYQQAKAKQTEQVKTVPAALNLYYKQKIKSYFDQLNAK